MGKDSVVFFICVFMVLICIALVSGMFKVEPQESVTYVSADNLIMDSPVSFRLYDGRSISINCDFKYEDYRKLRMFIIDSTRKENPIYEFGTKFKMSDGRIFSVPCDLSKEDSTKVQNILTP